MRQHEGLLFSGKRCPWLYCLQQWCFSFAHGFVNLTLSGWGIGKIRGTRDGIPPREFILSSYLVF